MRETFWIIVLCITFLPVIALALALLYTTASTLRIWLRTQKNVDTFDD